MTRINRLLVANRGEIARRVFLACREAGVGTVAVYSDADAKAPYVAEADLAVHLPGNTPAETYLRGDLVIAAAKRANADAIHPGYGFLSENANFARAVTDAGLIWVGPSPDAIEAMGSKLRSKALMQKAGVPTLPSVDVSGLDDEAQLKAGQEVGYPLLVKASAGGGGRGMRIVDSEADLLEAVTSAQREAETAFGDGTVFLERFIEKARHIEVQVFGDSHGVVVALFERDCSIQRRHQKVIEEAPSPSVDQELRNRLCTAAVDAAKVVAYVGAGTVEFVLDVRGEFYFLEMNTRLQVEHPVTELVTGIDLVRLQIAVAQGGGLPESVIQAQLSGHAIEARVYAEDVPSGFLPVAGTLHTFEVPSRPGIRVDSGFESGSVVSVHYDAMLAKVIAHAPTREDAAALLADTLSTAKLHGVTTNRDFLVWMLRSDDFLANRIDTSYLDRAEPAELGDSLADARTRELHAVAAALAGQADRRAKAKALPTIPSGWRNVAAIPETATFEVGTDRITVAYQLRRGGLWLEVNGTRVPGARLIGAAPTSVELEIDGLHQTFAVEWVGSTAFVDSLGASSTLVEQEALPEPGADGHAGSLVAPMPGTVARVLVSVGDAVQAGDVLIVMEAMKMEHPVKAPADGVVEELLVLAGEQIDAGAALAVLG